jgi:hypothetical protein
MIYKLAQLLTIAIIYFTFINPVIAQFGNIYFQKNSDRYQQEILNLNYACILQATDSTILKDSGKYKSDLFYYILGTIILIAAAIIFKQRYEQYLKDKDRLQS